MTIRLAYLCGEYPRATDTFIRREVAGLRGARRGGASEEGAGGFHIETISVRRPAAGERGTDEQESERAGTHYLLPCSPLRLIADHLSLLTRSPLRYLRTLWMALTVRSPGLRALLYQVFYFAEAGLVAEHMRRRGLSHLHNHAPDASGYVTMLAAELGRFTYSMTIHGFGILSEPRRWNLKEKLERSLFTVCVSYHAMSQAMLWSDPRVWDRFHVVRCGVDAESYPIRTHERDDGRSLGGNLLFVGRFDRVKGLPLLIDAVASLAERYPALHLDLVGDGPERDSIEGLVREKCLDDHITFHGYLSSDEVRERYAQAAVFVMSSFSEGIPVVLMEAMASGVAVIAPRITGIPELVEEGVNGLLATPGDSNSLARGIDRLLRDPSLRSAFGKAARETVLQRFNLNNEVESLREVFQSRLAGLQRAEAAHGSDASASRTVEACKPVAVVESP